MAELKTHYEYSEVISWLETKGKELFTAEFTIDHSDQSVLFQLIAYFLRDVEACTTFGISLNKGILLSGPVGCGKTTLMTLMKYLARVEYKFYVKACRDISFEFIQDGYQTIHKYSTGKLHQSDPKIICFDDLGTENNLKYFGNECNIMAEITLSRYDIFISKRIVTHITTNLSASEIELHYGARVRSRMREMFNLISFDGKARDKRR